MNHPQDHFSTIAGAYNEGRIKYPIKLYEYLVELCDENEIAWDCATGSGQAAVDLSSYFTQVIATDMSDALLSYAIGKDNIEFRSAPAEDSGITTGSVDLVTVAQAIHWFEFSEFWHEVKRVLKPNGVLAYWGYVWPKVDDRIDVLLENFKEKISTFWPERSHYLQNDYVEVDAPFMKIKTPGFYISETWSHVQYLRHLSSWSGTCYHRESTKIDLVSEMKEDFISAWGDVKRGVQWPLVLKVYKKI